MMVRKYKWNVRDVYEYYNVGVNGWAKGDIPDPPNPKGLQAFMMACVDTTVKQINKENDPGTGAGRNRPERRRI